ncbi:RES domain-containing protein [Photobacterium phosphoreum]|uniref:HEPN-associated N-terminal domain-containing protein n=1 Tax=Photobacterium phosphoreum TaxID=659 RepID=UPI0007F90479|nr:HEPN-associated N-terminal domain-containing protein [Photobacterium phosphoreum]OBU35996.1 hypothetical protein AYY25_05840 [Photobacterium phosphoreum]PSU79782.1 RES domain-containing protein [Photobacterium phosphoreum]
MGYFSDLSILMNEGPQLTELDKNVCIECVVDAALQNLVEKNLTSRTCDYCGEENDVTAIAAPFNTVMNRICESVLKEYSDAQNVDMPWVEKEWLVDETYIEEVLMEFDPGWDSTFSEDVVGCFDPSTYWVRHSDGDWSVSDPSDTLMYGWGSFKEQVLTKTRYLFLAEPEDEFSSGRPDYIPIASMLDALGNTCIKESMVTVIPAGTEFFRVRHAAAKERFTTFSEMGVPPVGVASAGRMNPAGISYLYLAYQKETAEKEVLEWSKRWFTAKYKTKVDIPIIDFSIAPSVPSVFEPELYESRHNRYFLHAIIKDLIAPVSKDGKEHVDYVPTQIVSEYFRYKFKDESGNGIMGLKYPSVKDDTGTNIAVFSSDNEELEQMFELLEIREYS